MPSSPKSKPFILAKAAKSLSNMVGLWGAAIGLLRAQDVGVGCCLLYPASHSASFRIPLPGACACFEYLKARIDRTRLFVQRCRIEIRIKRKVVGFGYDEYIHYCDHGRILVHLAMPFGNRKRHDSFAPTACMLASLGFRESTKDGPASIASSPTFLWGAKTVKASLLLALSVRLTAKS